MNEITKETIRRQFGAALEMLENAITCCTHEIWTNRTYQPEFWYLAYHTLFWLDFYLEDTPDDFAPPKPFGLEELDPAGVIPDRQYSATELLAYLEHGRAKFHRVIEAMTDEKARRRFHYGSIDMSLGELLLYNLRHVQHHIAQLNLILRMRVDTAPGWVIRSKE